MEYIFINENNIASLNNEFLKGSNMASQNNNLSPKIIVI